MISIVLVTHPNEASVNACTEALLQARLAACVQAMPIQSTYTWQGKLQRDTEILTLIKTRPELFEKVKQCVLRHHPYDVPQIIEVLSSNVHDAYALWLNQNTR